MGNIHFIGGEKGGVGKSTLARIMAQYFIDHQVPFIGFDTDKSHGALIRFYRDFASDVLIDRYESLDRVVEAAVEVPERRVLVDLAAQTHQFLEPWMRDSGLLETQESLGVRMTYWHVMDNGRDSVDLLQHLLATLGGRIHLILVQNQVRGDRFELLHSSGAQARAASLDAKTLILGKLQETSMQKIDAHSMSFWAAANQTDKFATGIGLLERQRIKLWLDRVYYQLAELNI